jgi:hypothetical protein
MDAVQTQTQLPTRHGRSCVGLDALELASNTGYNNRVTELYALDAAAQRERAPCTPVVGVLSDTGST